MEAQLKHNGVFQKLVHHLKDAQGSVPIRFSSDEIKIKTFKPESITTWLNVSLDPARLFDSYQCSVESFIRQLDMSLLSRLLQHASNNDEQDRVVKLETNSDALIVRSETAETFVDYDMNLPHVPLDIEIVDQEWVCSVTMPAAKLQSILTLYAEGKSKICGIGVDQDGISFSATSGDDNRSTTFLRHGQGGVDVVFYNEPQDIPMCFFSVHRLNLIAKSASIAETVTLRMEETITPVELDYHIHDESQAEDRADVVHLKYYILPELDDGTVETLELKEETDAMFEARIKGDSNLVKLLPHLVAFPLARMELSKSGLTMQSMDCFHFSHVDVSLPSSAFDSFRVDQLFAVGVNLCHINMALKRAEQDDIISFAVHKDEYLEIKIESPSRDEITKHGKSRRLGPDVYS